METCSQRQWWNFVLVEEKESFILLKKVLMGFLLYFPRIIFSLLPPLQFTPFFLFSLHSPFYTLPIYIIWSMLKESAADPFDFLRSFHHQSHERFTRYVSCFLSESFFCNVHFSPFVFGLLDTFSCNANFFLVYQKWLLYLWVRIRFTYILPSPNTRWVCCCIFRLNLFAMLISCLLDTD